MMLNAARFFGDRRRPPRNALPYSSSQGRVESSSFSRFGLRKMQPLCKHEIPSQEAEALSVPRAKLCSDLIVRRSVPKSELV